MKDSNQKLVGWKWTVVGMTLVGVSMLNGCFNMPSAKYRSWTQADHYFYSQENKQAKKSAHARCEGSYRVQKGDTVLGIAKACGIRSIALINANALLPPFRLQIGQSLIIPKTIYEAERHFQRKQRPPQSLWQLPVAKPNHQKKRVVVKGKKLLLAVDEPTPIYPVASGKVVYIGKDLGGYGLMLIVKHPDNYLSVYRHIQASFVEKNRQVSPATQLGIVSSPVNSEWTPYVEARYLGRKVAIHPLLSGKISAKTTSRSSVVSTL